jgi:hypothetical protein
MANDQAATSEGEGKRVENIAPGSDTTAYDEDAHDTEGECHYTWLEDYLERLAGKDDYREFRERYYGTPEYYTMVASLAA